MISLSGKCIFVFNSRIIREVHGFPSSYDFQTFWIKDCWKITGIHFKIRISNILIDVNDQIIYNFGRKFFSRYLIKCFTLSCQKTLTKIEDCPCLKRTLLSDSLHSLSCYTNFRVLCKSATLSLSSLLNIYSKS